MHTHFSALSALGAFLAIIMVGTVWRLAAAHLAVNSRPVLARVGRIMAFQY